MSATSTNDVNPVQANVDETIITIAIPRNEQSETPEPRLEFSLNWFDQWTFNWSCCKSTWQKYTGKLKSPISKGIAIGTGIAIGVGATIYGHVPIDKSQNPAFRATSIEAPALKK
jgi:hypothetical protein